MSEQATLTMLDVNGLSVEQGVRELVAHAADMPASDLFILTNEQHVSVQVRFLGLIQPLAVVPLEHGRRMISHIKAISGMDLTERRKPLDGRWVHEREDGSSVDLRISMIPTHFGEDLAMRLLPRDQHMYRIDELGMTDQQREQFQTLIESPSGVILVTGPTGAGKTASLYASLLQLHDGKKKINTIEDPVEYTVDGLRQSEIRPKIGLGFADLLLSCLRQSPDVIMIGEIRDEVTANTAIRAGNSGHLVLATLHAPTAAAAIQSMRALGTTPHFLSTSMRGIIAQRLVRTLCPHCKLAFDLDIAPHTFDEVKQWLSPGEGQTLYAPRGCEHCAFTGYAGRTGVFEVMPISRELRSMIAAGKSAAEVRDKAVADGMLEFRQSALLKVAQGLTSTEEVFRVIPSEHLLVEEDI